MKQPTILENNVSYCCHISSSDMEEIYHFARANKNGEGLVVYLKEYALQDEETNMARTYIVRWKENNEIVGYFSLKSGLMVLQEGSLFRHYYNTIPGVELANFAVNGKFLERHPEIHGIGYIIFCDYILPIVKQWATYIGTKILYIFALPYESLMENYKKYGFSRLTKGQEKLIHGRIKPKYDKDCIFMYQVL